MSHAQMMEEREMEDHYFGRSVMAVQNEDVVLGMVREDPDECGCHGSGWILGPFDTWEQCPAHHTNQLDPELEMYLAMEEDLYWDERAEEESWLRANWIESSAQKVMRRFA